METTLKQTIEETAQLVREKYNAMGLKAIVFKSNVSFICIEDSYTFEGWEAENLISMYQPQADKLNVNIEDLLLYSCQGW